MTELQASIAMAADAAGVHSTAPALLVQAMAALGQLSATTDQVTEAGRRPFRIPPEWADQLGQLAWTVYLLADQTSVDLDSRVRDIADRVATEAADADRVRGAGSENDSWF